MSGIGIGKAGESSASAGNLKVVVRCRPLNTRELTRGATCLISMNGESTYLEPPPAGSQDAGGGGRERERRAHAFTFDKSYWSAGSRDEPNYASQRTLFEDLGLELVQHSMEGYNTCIFAYGQTGSGKSYTMNGYGADRGIIPLTTEELFNRIEKGKTSDPDVGYQVEVSYIEIYNERVRDLLNPSNAASLRVREHPSLGPYVEDLTKLVVQDHDQLLAVMSSGNSTRTIAATAMNETSSRSHTIFSLVLTQRRLDPRTKAETSKSSKISLVDLAGSERATKTKAEGVRLKEGATINKSLTTLGQVIKALAESSNSTSKASGRMPPYRDSVLTWLLKESLSGNSKTTMVASVSPADYDETLSTLRYANSAKSIRTHAVVNEDKNARFLRELLEEVEALRNKLATSDLPTHLSLVTYSTRDGTQKTITQEELQERIETSEKLIASLNESWEQKIEKTRAIQSEREKALEDLGITLNQDLLGLHAPRNTAHIVNLSDDPFMSECLLYSIPSGRTIVGRMDSPTARIKLSGPGVASEHCAFDNTGGSVTLTASESDKTLVNGRPLTPNEPVTLLSGYRIIIDRHVFRFSSPAESANAQPRVSDTPRAESPYPLQATVELEDPGAGMVLDWDYALREAALHRLNGRPGFGTLKDDDLDSIFDDLAVVRSIPPRTTPTRGSIIMTAGRSSDTKVEDSQSDTAVDVELSLEESTRTTRPKRSPNRIPLADIFGGVKAGLLDRSTALDPPRTALDIIRSSIRPHIVRWRDAPRQYTMATTVLRMAACVKEANIIAKSAQQSITYDFATMDSNDSVLEDLQLFDATAGQSISSPRSPQVSIRVMDLDRNVAYCWDVDHFTSQLARMRRWHMSSLEYGESVSQHLSTEGLFRDSSSPRMTPLATTMVPLTPLNWTVHGQQETIMDLPIMCTHTSESVGTCRVTFIPYQDSRRDAPVKAGPGKPKHTLLIDQISSTRWTSDVLELHFQLSLPDDLMDTRDTATSNLVDLTRSPLHSARLYKVLTLSGKDTITSQRYAVIKFFGVVTRAYLQRIITTNLARDKEVGLRKPHTAAPRQALLTRPHLLACYLEIQELNAAGDYDSTEVRSASASQPIFELHQGMQRRLKIKLFHNSGKTLDRCVIAKPVLSGIKRIDSSCATVSESDEVISVNHVASDMVSEADGTVSYTFTGSWTSESSLMLKPTAESNIITMRLSYQTTVVDGSKPATVNQEVRLRIMGRHVRRTSSSFVSYFVAPPKTYATYLHQLLLQSPPSRTSGSLWGLDTCYEPLEGEEVLQGWQPRSPVLVDDFVRTRQLQCRRADVEATRAFLSLQRDPPIPVPPREILDHDIMITECVALWKSAVVPSALTEVLTKTSNNSTMMPLVPSIMSVLPISVVAKKGSVNWLMDAVSNRWENRWIVLFRPYLRIFTDSSETNEIGVITITNASVEESHDIERLLNVNNVLTILGITNATVLSFLTEKERHEWLVALRIS